MSKVGSYISRKELLKEISNLENIQVKSLHTPYKMEIEIPGIEELKVKFKIYFKHNVQTIPKIIHQVWIGDNPPPWQWIDSFRKKFLSAYPEWEYKLWRESDISELKLINRDWYEMEEVLSGKVNILRYELLYQFGGIYIDADSEWINNKPLHDLLDSANQTGVFAGREDEYMLANGVIGCAMNNPIMYHIIMLLGKTYFRNRLIKNHPTWISSGPRFFSEAVIPFEITEYPTHYFYPVSWHTDNRGIDTSQFIDSYMMQYGYSTNDFFK